jgi:fibronectin-binding autotransporter adhesin
MTTKPNPIRKSSRLEKIRSCRPALLLFALQLIAFSAINVRAQTLIWDANGGSGPADGSGTWHTAGDWWNGTTTVSWTDGLGATFGSGSGSAGSYTVNVDSPVTVTNLLFQTPGSYVLTGTQITFNGAGIGSLPRLVVNPGVTAEIDSYILNSPGIYYTNNGGVLNLGGGGSCPSGSPNWFGLSQSTSILNFTAGTYTQVGTLGINGLTMNMTGGTINHQSRIDIGRTGASTVNVTNGAQLNANTSNGNNDNNNIEVSRGSPAVLNIWNGGVASGYAAGSSLGGNITLIPDSSSQATLNLYSGGTLNVGSGAGGSPGVNYAGLRTLRIVTGAMSYSANAMAIVNVSGGTLTAQSIQFGSVSGGTYTANPTNQLNVTGGGVYLASGSITQPVSTGTKFGINLSGGTIAAIANWSPACSVPMNLTNINGNVTFQAGDINGNPYNMTLSGALTGIGGFNKVGGGVLTLSGADNFAGNTVVSNGTLAISTANMPTNGSVALDGSEAATYLPTNSVQLGNVGQHWQINGSLTYAAGTPTADFNFGVLPPSTTVAAIQVTGNVVLTVTPQVEVDGTAISAGTYPLIHYGGSLSGTWPTVPILPTSTSGYVSNSVANQTLYLVVTSSPVTAGLVWKTGTGPWDFTTKDWTVFNVTTNYMDGDGVTFDDTASGASPFTVTLNTTVAPGSISVNNTTTSYVIAGTGSIGGGSTVLTKKGTGALTLTQPNTYGGGTLVDANSGPLNINYGGDNSGLNSAIGTGPLTLNLGSIIDNTSGSNVTLNANNSMFWGDDFTFVGTSNLNLGLGSVTLGSAQVTLSVNSNTLTVNNLISDNGNGYGIAKSGSGTLTLSNYNTFSGGVTLNAGQLNINNGGDGGLDSAIGSGTFTIYGGTVDNTSGSALALQTAISETWLGSFVFNGTTNLDLGSGEISIPGNGPSVLVLTLNSNTLSTEGVVYGGGKTVTKNGPGTLVLGGVLDDNYGLGLIVNDGLVQLNKTTSGSYHAVGYPGLTVNTNGLVVTTGSGGDQISDQGPVALTGGIWDMNGQNETVDAMAITNGTLRNSSGATCQLNPWAGGNAVFSIGGSFANFDVAAGGSLIINFPMTGTGSITLTNLGTLTLLSNNTYTASTLINAGTLALSGVGTIDSSPLIEVSTGAVLDVSARIDQTLTLASGQTLTGGGSLNGTLVAPAGSIVAPGPISTVGTLTIADSATLAGNLSLKIVRTGAQTSDQLVSSTGTITYGGTLTVTNIGADLQVGDTFQLFPSAVSGFTAISLPTTSSSGATYTWNNNVAVNGSITVASVGSAINPLPGTIQFSFSGGTLNLGWPTNAGWLLQVQTNSLMTGLGTNWVTVPGSASITNLSVTNSPANGAVFYRMTNPNP